MKYPRITLWALMGLCVSTSAALAESAGAPANPSSDYKSNELKLEVTPGKIDVREGKLNVGANYLTTSQGQQGGNVKLDASKKYHIWSDGSEGPKADTMAAVILIEPQARGSMNVTKDGGIRKMDGEVGGVGLGYLSAREVHESPTATAQRLAFQERAEALRKQIGEAQTSLNQLGRCLGRLDEPRYYCEPAQVAFASDKAKGLTPDDTAAIEKLKDAQKKAAAQIESSTKAMLTLKDEVKKAGFGLNERNKSYYSYEKDPLDFEILAKRNEVGATVDFKPVGVSGTYRQDKDLGYTQGGAYVKFLDVSWHAAGRFNGVNLDLCGRLMPIALVAGQQTSDKRAFHEGVAKMCAGVELGKLGHLGHEMGAKTDFDGFWQLSNETTLKNIGGTGLGLGHTHEWERTKDGMTVDRNLFGVQWAY